LPIAVITPSGPTSFCAGGSVDLTASGGTGYVWSTGSTNATITVTESGTFTVTVTDTNGCTDTESITITQYPLPNAVITPSGPTSFCAGNSVDLTASGGTGYVWSTGSTNATITVTESGTFTVTVTDANGCIDTESITTAQYPMPIAVITPSGPTTFCLGGSVSLTASGGTGYLWSTGATSSTIVVAASGVYTVTVTENGCQDTESIEVTVNQPALVSVTIVASANPVCQGSSVTFTATPVNGGTMPFYQWKVNNITQGGNSPVFTYTPVNGDVVTCRLQSNASCITGNPATSNPITMTVNAPQPVSVTIVADANPVNPGTLVTFTATPVNGGATPVYAWFVNGMGMGASSPVLAYVPDNGDEVVCQLTSSQECVSGNPATSNSIIMSVNPTVPEFETVSNVIVTSGQVVCYNATNTITVAGSGTTFQVQAGGSATFIAGQRIFFLPGTTVQPGGYMHGYISDIYCGGQQPSMVTITGQEEPDVPGSATYRIYPNPVTENFTLECLSPLPESGVRADIYSMKGERLRSVILHQTKQEINFGDAPAGLYFVKVQAEGKLEVIKLVKGR
jgi:hypothetical protein